MVKNKLFICRDYHIQPSEIERMPYYEYEYMLEDIKEIQIEQEKQNEEQEKRQSEQYKSMNPNSMMRNMQNSMKMPSMGSMPKINIPKF